MTSQQSRNFSDKFFLTLQGLGYDPHPEHSIGSQVDRTTDIALLDVELHKIAIEVDGETHFSRNVPFLPLGITVVGTRMLQGQGWHVIRINQQEWVDAYNQCKCEELLEEKILECIGVIILES
eukprot:TRINITY_DN3862_c1_g1_i2.p4 TRINITY_DN3862_c1_g1~~TRINITY_DN3862_c1_g1_i2.p4  ORF type:complete len:123 (+),score=22.71 TRINITY_DN3862_c1_g1_i2:445-813(+)